MAEKAATSAAGGCWPPSSCRNAHAPQGSIFGTLVDGEFDLVVGAQNRVRLRQHGLEHVVEQHVSRNTPADEAVTVAAERLALIEDMESGAEQFALGATDVDDLAERHPGVGYRAGSPAGLTAKDMDGLAKRGIRTVCDLRASEEHAAEPSPFASRSDVAYWTRDYAAEAGDLVAVLGAPDASAAKSRAAMIGLYRQLPEEHAASYRQMFAYLAEGKVPLAFKCSAGKDRTGVGAALVLSLLGVPRETVVADYALSDDLVDYMAKIETEGDSEGPYAALARLPREVVAPLLASDPAYIEAALGALEAKHGSVEGFIARKLGVTKAMKQAIVANLTEPG